MKEKDLEEFINKFLAKLNPSGWRTNRKSALQEFEKVIFGGSQTVIRDATLIRLLLRGSKQYPKGLLKICGEHSVGSLVNSTLTKASVMALRVLANLLDPAKYPEGSRFFLEQLKHIPVSDLGLPNFAHHFIRESMGSETASDIFEVPALIITQYLIHVSDLTLADFIQDDWARYLYLRQVIGIYSQKPEHKTWKMGVVCTNFSHAMVTEFLTTSKHRLPRDVWLRNLNNYFMKCRPILKSETIEILLSGTEKPKTKGLMRLSSQNKPHSIVAKEVLTVLLDEAMYPDAGRFLDFLLERRSMIQELNYDQLIQNAETDAFDLRIFNLLANRAKLGDVKDVLKMLHDKPGELTQPIDAMDMNVDTKSSRHNSFENMKKAYRKISRGSGGVNVLEMWSDGSEESYPSVLSMLDDRRPPSPERARSESGSSRSESGSSSRASSGRYADDYSEFASPTSPTPMSPAVSPRSSQIQVTTEQVPLLVTLEQFFFDHAPKFSRIEYRRLLIFLMSLVTSNQNSSSGGQLDVTALFMELGMDSNPQFEKSVAEICRILEATDEVNFNEEVCHMWASCIMREIAMTERYLDP